MNVGNLQSQLQRLDEIEKEIDRMYTLVFHISFPEKSYDIGTKVEYEGPTMGRVVSYHDITINAANAWGEKKDMKVKDGMGLLKALVLYIRTLQKEKKEIMLNELCNKEDKCKKT